jgi:hypothetical protein
VPHVDHPVLGGRPSRSDRYRQLEHDPEW